jgi:hypothetical protein
MVPAFRSQVTLVRRPQAVYLSRYAPCAKELFHLADDLRKSRDGLVALVLSRGAVVQFETQLASDLGFVGL